MGRGQRRVSPRHPAGAALRGTAAGSRAPRHLRRPLALDRVDQRAQRRAAADDHGAPGRGRGVLAREPRAAVGPRRADLPRRTHRARRRGAGGAGAPTAGGARDRPDDGARLPRRPPRRRRGRRAGRGRGRPRHLAGGPTAARAAVPRSGGAAVAPGSARGRPQTGRGALRVRLPAGDVQARGHPAVGLLGAAGPLRRPAGRQARRGGRPSGGVLRVHALHQDVELTPAMRAAIEREIRSLARWLRLEIEDERSGAEGYDGSRPGRAVPSPPS